MELFSDWLGREGGAVVTWWLLATLAGAAVWPLLFRLMRGLPDRGYTLMRPAGVMLTGFVFWSLASLGLLHNSPGAMVFAWLVVLGLSWGVFLRERDRRDSVREWVREHWLVMVISEIVFAALFVGWALFRAHYPDMSWTERPMEIMFLNGVRASDTFPPRDPWLAGYSISYYYFGYVIAAMLSDLSSVSSGVGFNLMMALLFAMGGTGALGVVYNLLRRVGTVRGVAISAGMMGAVFLLLMGDLGAAVVELPFQGYAPEIASADYFEFWDVEVREPWKDVTKEVGDTVEIPFRDQLLPTDITVSVPLDDDRDGVPNWDDGAKALNRWGGSWWFWYSRTIRDRDLNGARFHSQPIAEEPSFSFILSDMHPHVLAIPFAVLAIGLMLNLVLGGRELRAYEYPLYAIWVGGMIFMNSWDGVYLPLLVGAELVRRLLVNGSLSLDDLLKTARFALVIAVLTVVLYALWFVSFESQASGVMPNLVFPTQWQQFFLQFGIFLVMLVPYLVVQVWRAGRRFNWQAGLLAVAFLMSTLILLAGVRGKQIWDAPERLGAGDAQYNAAVGERNNVYTGADFDQSWATVMGDVVAKRTDALPSEALLLVMIFLVVGRLFAKPDPEFETSPANGFALLMIGAGAVLTLAPDFVYLKDNFGVRMNTVFKLYYQGWILFSLASAFALWAILAGARARGRGRLAALVGRGVYGLAAAIFILAGMVYPVMGVRYRAIVEGGRYCDEKALAKVGQECPEQRPLTLNGVPTMVSQNEYQAIQCLQNIEKDRDAILVEAPGGAYNSRQSRFSGLTGIPTLIGWQNHEGQWRGESYSKFVGSRVGDIQELYTTTDWTRTWALIDQYGIDYIVVGEAERQMVEELIAAGGSGTLADGLSKFDGILEPVCATETAQVYRTAPN